MWTRPQDDELDAEGVPKSFRETMKQVALMLNDDELLNNAKSSIHDGQHSTSFSDIHAKFFAHPAARQSLAHQPLRAPQSRRLAPPEPRDDFFARPATGHVGRHRQQGGGAFDPPSGGYFPKARAWHRQQEEARTNGWLRPRPTTAQQFNPAPPFQSQLAPAASRDYFRSQFDANFEPRFEAAPARRHSDEVGRPRGPPPQSDRDREFLRAARERSRMRR